jgi:hypothetical protein
MIFYFDYVRAMVGSCSFCGQRTRPRCHSVESFHFMVECDVIFVTINVCFTQNLTVLV